jgi:O-methyltransferase
MSCKVKSISLPHKIFIMGFIADFIRSIYRMRDLEVVIRPIRNPLLSDQSQIILPYSNYAPWKVDRLFSDTYDKINGHTLVDIYRCWELWDSLDNVIANIEGDILEVGVWRGGTGGIMAKKLSMLDPSRTLYLADTFEGVVKATKNDSKYIGGEHSDTSLNLVNELLTNKLGLKNYKILKGIFPDDTGSEIENHKIAMAHVDVDVYQSTKEIVEWIWPRLSIGGVIFYDDYGFTPCDGVIKFVNEQKKLKDRHTFYNLNGHAITVKLA